MTTAESELMKFVSPEYFAAMECAPLAKLVVAYCADPAASVALPICVCLSKNAIVPVGVLAPDCGATFAVNVTLAPALICVAEAVIAVVVPVFAGAETVIAIAVDVEVA